jgi:hypothetical protein
MGTATELFMRSDSRSGGRDWAELVRLTAVLATISVQAYLLLAQQTVDFGILRVSQVGLEPLRLFIALWFFAGVPGVAWIHLFRTRDPATRLCLILGSSIGINAIVGIPALYIGFWTPTTVFVTISLIAAGGAIHSLLSPALEVRRPVT